MPRVITLLLSFILCRQVLAQPICFEGDTCLPEVCTSSWTRIGTFDADRWFEDGWFFQFVELGVWAPDPYGEFDGYRRTIDEFALVEAFFVEWRVRTDVTPEDIDGGPVVVSAAGDGSALYHYSITNGQVRFSLDNPGQLILFVDVVPDLAHTHRLEIRNSSSYQWFIDGSLIDAGTSIGPYPIAGSRLNWSARYYLHDHTTKWDYVRYGIIPDDHSGDFDSNGLVDANDLYFFVDCLLGPGGAWPGCKWADMNSDGTADGADLQAFVQALTNS